MTSRRRGWVAAAAVLVLGWLTGYWVWHQPAEPFADVQYGTIPFSGVVTGVVAGLALVGYGTAAALLRDAGRWRTRFGWTALATTTVLVGYLLSFAWFGGFCLDPEDYCLTTWPSRVLPLLGALAALGAAAASCEMRRRVADVGGGVR